jgi:hypothetical protein
MKLPVTLLSIWILIITTGAKSLAPSLAPSSSVLLSNTTFQEKHGGHGCATHGCNETQSSGSTLGSGYLEAFYGAIIISFAALA